uniref:Uncharacterized protein n=1 Tax=Leersia perrieri TaxID=77586 RepID=A0A0D9W2D5_9ORYZ
MQQLLPHAAPASLGGGADLISLSLAGARCCVAAVGRVGTVHGVPSFESRGWRRTQPRAGGAGLGSRRGGSGVGSESLSSTPPHLLWLPLLFASSTGGSVEAYARDSDGSVCLCHPQFPTNIAAIQGMHDLGFQYGNYRKGVDDLQNHGLQCNNPTIHNVKGRIEFVLGKVACDGDVNGLHMDDTSQISSCDKLNY